MLLFIYGEMLEGRPHHDFLIGMRAAFKASTWVEGFLLYDCGFGPAMAPSTGHAIKGEVWEVPAANVRALDRFEGHPQVFKRATVEVEDGSLAVAYVYQGDVGAAVGITSGDWLDYVGLKSADGDPNTDVPF